MTYVLGFRQPSMNAIISDARGSWKGKDGKWYGENNILKTGLLFPGCIYGIIGNLALADDLILSFKESIGEERDTEVLWQRFNKVVGCGGFAAGGAEHFQILLSKRSSTGPDLLILDSANGISPIQPNAPYSIHSFGSGKKILDDFVKAKARPTLEALRAYLCDERQYPIAEFHKISPYFFCLWLSEWSLTTQKSLLEDHLVDGAFHFICQTDEFEETQQPAIYIFSAADRKRRKIYSWWYRVAYARGGLYIECWSPPNQDTSPLLTGSLQEYALFSSAASPGVKSLAIDMIWAELRRDLENQPYWFFCGLGYTNWRDRKAHFFAVDPHGKREGLIGEDGQFRPEIRQLIESGFTDERLSWVPDIQVKG